MVNFFSRESLVVINNLRSQLLPACINGGSLHFLQCLLDIFKTGSNCERHPVCLQGERDVFLFCGSIKATNDVGHGIFVYKALKALIISWSIGCISDVVLAGRNSTLTPSYSRLVAWPPALPKRRRTLNGKPFSNKYTFT